MPNLNSNRVLKHPGSPKSDERLFESKVNVPEGNRRALIDLLNARLADTIDMQTQAKFAHCVLPHFPSDDGPDGSDVLTWWATSEPISKMFTHSR